MERKTFGHYKRVEKTLQQPSTQESSEHEDCVKESDAIETNKQLRETGVAAIISLKPKKLY